MKSLCKTPSQPTHCARSSPAGMWVDGNAEPPRPSRWRPSGKAPAGCRGASGTGPRAIHLTDPGMAQSAAGATSCAGRRVSSAPAWARDASCARLARPEGSSSIAISYGVSALGARTRKSRRAWLAKLAARAGCAQSPGLSATLGRAASTQERGLSAADGSRDRPPPHAWASHSSGHSGSVSSMPSVRRPAWA